MKKLFILFAIAASASLSSCIYEISPEELEQHAIERGETIKIDLTDRGNYLPPQNENVYNQDIIQNQDYNQNHR